MSISAGLLVIAIVLIRAIALNKLPKVAFLVLWGVVLVRLLVPVAIPMPFGINFQSVLTEAISTVSPNNAMSNISEAEQNGLYWFTLGRVATGELGRDETMQGQAPNIALVAIVWLIGVVALLTFFAIVYIKNHRGLRFATIIRNNDFIDGWLDDNKLMRRISILQSDMVTTPVAVGLFKPRIILPKSMNLSDTELLSHILMHEYYHIKRLDALWKILMLLAVCTHWFNPLAWVMFILASRDMELTCDEMVIRHFGQDSKTAYAYSIIGMAEMRSKCASLYNGFSKNAAKERIESIMKMKKTGIIGKIAALTMVSALTIGTLTAFAADRVTADTDVSIFTPPPQSSTMLTLNNLAFGMAERTLRDFGVDEEFGITASQDGNVYYRGQLVRSVIFYRSYEEDDSWIVINSYDRNSNLLVYVFVRDLWNNVVYLNVIEDDCDREQR